MSLGRQAVQRLLDLMAQLALGVAALALLLGLPHAEDRVQAGGERRRDLLPQRAVGLAEVLAALGVAEQDAVRRRAPRASGADTSPVKAPSGASCMFCAKTSMSVPRARVRRSACSAVNGTQIATSTPSTSATSGASASTYASASAIVLYIFQLPAMNGVRLHATKNLHAGQGLALDKLERRAAAGGQVGHLVLQPELRDRRGASRRLRQPSYPRVAATAAAIVARARGERLELERAHRAVPEDRAPRGAIAAAYASARLRADVEAHPAGGHVDAVELLALGVGGELAAEHEVDGQPQLAGVVEQPRARARASSASHSESPTSWPCAAKNGKAIAPPMSTSSATSRNVSSTPILSVTFAPPTTATSGRAGSARIDVSVATSRSSSSPAARRSKSSAAACVEACARCAAPKASST